MINQPLEQNQLNFENGLSKVKEELDKLLTSSPKVIAAQTEHLTKAKGKFIRAVSLLACAENSSGMIDSDAVNLATCIELLHLATLVHDDVIDNSSVRRGVPTLHTKFGRKSAVICGDYLFCLALKTAYSVTNKQEYFDYNIPDYMSRVCLGELMQNMNNQNFDLSVRRYLRIISGKTAALFQASFHAGAMLCDQSKNQINLYSRLGYYVGMIFQLTDDCIDYESSQDLAKKPVSSDFEQGVITLPLIYALRKNPDLKIRALSGKVTKEEIKDAVKNTGGIFYTQSVSKKYYDKAQKIIRKLNAHDDKKIRLTAILDKAFKGLGGINIG